MMSKDRTKSVYINKSHKDEFSKVKSDRPEAVHVRVIYIKIHKMLGETLPRPALYGQTRIQPLQCGTESF